MEQVPVLEQFEWQKAVLDKDLTTPPTSPTKGDRYLILTGDTGTAWEGHNSELTYYDGTDWQFISPLKGMSAYVKDEDVIYRYNGTDWLQAGGGSGDATSIQGTAVATTAPTTGQILKYDGTLYVPSDESGGALPPADPFHAATLESGWTAYGSSGNSGTNTVGYSIDYSGYVHLAGTADGRNSTDTTDPIEMFLLPAGYRPIVIVQQFIPYLSVSSGNWEQIMVYIYPSGTFRIITSSPTDIKAINISSIIFKQGN